MRRWLAVCAVALALGGGAFAQEKKPVYPNLLAEVSRDFLDAAARQEIESSDAINEYKDKTSIIGTALTKAIAGIDFVPSIDGAIVELRVNGNTDAATNAIRKAVNLSISTRVGYVARKRIRIDENGLVSLAEAEACPHIVWNNVNCIGTKFRPPVDPLVRKLTYKVFEKKRPETEGQILSDAQKKLIEQVEKNAAEKLEEANEQIELDIREPMKKRGVWPQRFRFMTSDTTLAVLALLDAPDKKPQTFSPLPEIVGSPDFSIRIEESLLNNASHALFAGKSYTGDELDREFSKLLGPLLGEVKTVDAGDKPFKITFPKEKPIETHFSNQGFKITLRGTEFASGNDEYDGMEVTGTYKLTKTQKGLVAERQGDLQVFPPGFKPGVDKMGARELAFARLLGNKFGKALKPKFEVEGLGSDEMKKKVGELWTTQVQSDKGWLVLGWKRAPK